MLVLGRRKGESLLIGEDIEITILESGADGVKIGIKAPKTVNVLRKELYIATEDTNKDASQTGINLNYLQQQIKKMKNMP